MPVMPDAVARLDDGQVEPQREARQRGTVRERAPLEEAVRRGPDPRALPVIDGLLRQPEVPARPPADLDDHEGAGWTGVDGDQIELVPADMHVPGQDRPARRREPVGDQGLGAIA